VCAGGEKEGAWRRDDAEEVDMEAEALDGEVHGVLLLYTA